MLASHEHENLLDAMLDESVSPPIGLLAHGKQFLFTKDPHLVLHDSCHAVHLGRPITMHSVPSLVAASHV